MIKFLLNIFFIFCVFFHSFFFFNKKNNYSLFNSNFYKFSNFIIILGNLEKKFLNDNFAKFPFPKLCKKHFSNQINFLFLPATDLNLVCLNSFHSKKYLLSILSTFQNCIFFFSFSKSFILYTKSRLFYTLQSLLNLNIFFLKFLFITYFLK